MLEEYWHVVRCGRDAAATETFAVARRAHQRRSVLQRDYAFFGSRFEFRPVARMLFRPKEIHAASGKRQVVAPFPERNIEIQTEAGWVLALYDAVAHCHMQRITAGETGRVYFDGFPGK